MHESITLPNSTQTEVVNETKAASEEHYYNSPTDSAPTQDTNNNDDLKHTPRS